MENAIAYRGVDGIYLAEIIKDNKNEYKTGEVFQAAAVASMSQSPNSTTGSHYFNNQEMIVITAEGNKEIKVVCSVPELEDFARILGKTYDRERAMMIDSEQTVKYFAMGTRQKLTDGSYRYSWHLKVKIGTPNIDNKSEDSGTDISTIELPVTAIRTIHAFAKGKLSENGVWKPSAVKEIIVDEKLEKADLSDFFEEVKTPDTLVPIGSVQISVTSIPGSVKGCTKITVTPTKGEGNSYKYKTGASLTVPAISSAIGSGYKNWDGIEEVEATTNEKILVAEVDSENKVVKFGMTTVTAKDTDD